MNNDRKKDAEIRERESEEPEAPEWVGPSAELLPKPPRRKKRTKEEQKEQTEGKT